MLKHKRESVEWLEFELLQGFPSLVHAVFLRHGGVSPAPYHSLNVGGGTGDDAHNIRANRQKIQKLLACSSLVGSQQVHGSIVLEAPLSPDNEKCDGLVTRSKGVGLLIKHADCQAAIFYDPVLNVIGNVHTGWRGNVQNIYHEAIQQMARLYGSRPENLLVGISPSLGPCCAQFINYQTELPRPFWDYQVQPCYFDLWQISFQQLTKAGVLPDHIQIARICTYCGKDDCFSYRRDKPTGRHATVVSLKT